jgi:hypothetical protein
MSYRLRWEGRGIYRRFFGVIPGAEFHRAYLTMTGDPRYEYCRYIISDYLEAQPGADFSERDLRAIAELELLRYRDSPDMVQARVATDPQTLEYIRYYDSLGISPYRVATFATVAAARLWIARGPRADQVSRALSRDLEPAYGPPIASRDRSH